MPLYAMMIIFALRRYHDAAEARFDDAIAYAMRSARLRADAV